MITSHTATVKFFISFILLWISGEILIWFINWFPVCSKVNDYMYLNYILNRLYCMICFNCIVHCVSSTPESLLSTWWFNKPFFPLHRTCLEGTSAFGTAAKWKLFLNSLKKHVQDAFCITVYKGQINLKKSHST